MSEKENKYLQALSKIQGTEDEKQRMAALLKNRLSKLDGLDEKTTNKSTKILDGGLTLAGILKTETSEPDKADNQAQQFGEDELSKKQKKLTLKKFLKWGAPAVAVILAFAIFIANIGLLFPEEFVSTESSSSSENSSLENSSSSKDSSSSKTDSSSEGNNASSSNGSLPVPVYGEIKVDPIPYTAGGIYYIDKSEFDKGFITITGSLSNKVDSPRLWISEEGKETETNAAFDVSGLRWSTKVNISGWKNGSSYQVLVRDQKGHTSNSLTLLVRSNISFSNFRAFSSKSGGGLTDLALTDDVCVDFDSDAYVRWSILDVENPAVRPYYSTDSPGEKYSFSAMSGSKRVAGTPSCTEYINLSSISFNIFPEYWGNPDIKSGREYRVMVSSYDGTFKREFTFSTKRVDGKESKRPPVYFMWDEHTTPGTASMRIYSRTEDLNKNTEFQIIVSGSGFSGERTYRIKAEGWLTCLRINDLPAGSYTAKIRLVDGEEKGLLSRPSPPFTVSSIADFISQNGPTYFIGEYTYNYSDPNRGAIELRDYSGSRFSYPIVLNQNKTILGKNPLSTDIISPLGSYDPAGKYLYYERRPGQYKLSPAFLDQLPSGKNRFIMVWTTESGGYKCSEFIINVTGKA